MGHSSSSRPEFLDLRQLSVEEIERDPTSLGLEPAMLQFIRECEQAKLDHQRGVYNPTDADKKLHPDEWDVWLGEDKKNPSL